MFPDSVMFPIHSPPACIDQRQEGLFFWSNTDNTTDDRHISPMMIGTGQRVMLLHDEPIPPALLIAGAGRKLGTVLLIERAILDVQPEVSSPDFLLHDD